MIVDGIEIRLSDERHKYSSALAEYLDWKGTDYADEHDGDGDFGAYAMRFGRRILWYDERGFVDLDTFASVDLAKERFQIFEKFLSDFLNPSEVTK